MACKLVEELDLNKYTTTYDDNNNKIVSSSHDVVDLTPPRCKHIFAPDIDPSLILNDEATFEVLTAMASINCSGNGVQKH